MGAGLRGGGGWTGDSEWVRGGLGVWVCGGFHWAVVLVDLAMGLRSFVFKSKLWKHWGL